MKKKISSWIDTFNANPVYGPFLAKDQLKIHRLTIKDINSLKEYLTLLYIKHYLVKPYFTTENYPLLETRELLPSFDPDPWEYKHLPAFSLVVFDRPLSYFKEIFQFDILHLDQKEAHNCRPMSYVGEMPFPAQIQTLLSRMPKKMQEPFRAKFAGANISKLAFYPALLPFLTELDRGQVMAKSPGSGEFYLGGVYASFPSDLDAEIKRFGIKIGKFRIDDDDTYECHRNFVYQYLMELYGFPIVSERRTSAALFARRLHKLGERFMIFVLGQSDRCLTVISSTKERTAYPKVEKFALVQLDPDQTEVLSTLEKNNLFLDAGRRAAIMHVTYQQHEFNPHNVRQERALSVDRQEILHPLSGEAYTKCNVLKDVSNFLIRLNDIVRGEYFGRTVYKRTEVVENTDTEEKRLKVLYAWLTKHQVRIIGYSDEFFAKAAKILDDYLLDPGHTHHFENIEVLHQEVLLKFSYIRQARKVRLLEDISERYLKGERINYQRMLLEAVELLKELKFEIADYFEPLVFSIINLMERMLNNNYVIKNYIEPPEEEMTEYGLNIRLNYKKLVALFDDFSSVYKSRSESGRE